MQGAAMHLLRSIFLILTLLAQACPVPVLRAAEVKTKCPMSCCAGDGAAACGCATAPDAPQRSAPANVPPTAGRDLVPSLALVSGLEIYLPPPKGGTEGSATRMALADRHEGRAQRRLTVLHCSFLI
jgi:hypothetical protein